MPRVPRPSPCFLDRMTYLGYTHGAQRWRNPDEPRLYEWDDLHGEIEAYNLRGRHVGVLDARTGVQRGPAKKGRRINV